ncbi:hypothetical protein ACGF13_08250 [Kitasatospora sp. NPDC048286]|uniref:hypothetical protein n=1 Tax=Kitasatospora sp. NPDC048286 TaxID=3364047 RepID=UPI0037124896
MREVTTSITAPLPWHTIMAAFTNTKDSEVLTLEIERAVNKIDQTLTTGQPGRTFTVKHGVPFQVTVRRETTVLGQPGSLYFRYDADTDKLSFDAKASQLPDGVTCDDSSGKNFFGFLWHDQG